MAINEFPGLHMLVLKTDNNISYISHNYCANAHQAWFQSCIYYAFRAVLTKILGMFQDQIILCMVDLAHSCIPCIGHLPDNLVVMNQHGANGFIPPLAGDLRFLNRYLHVFLMVVTANIPYSPYHGFPPIADVTHIPPA